jgi:predicted aspartyl protease
MARRLAAAFAALLLAVAPAAEARAPAQTVPFEFLQDKQILFPIVINGRPAEAWLDSGASATVVDAAFARSIGLSLGRTVRADGVAGRVEGVRLAPADIRIGELKAPIRQVAVMDLSAVARVAPRPVQVILGREIFDHGVVDIDFANRRLTLGGRGFRWPWERPLPLRRSGQLRSFPIEIGRVRTEAILDLGNANALILDRDFAQAHGLLQGRRISTQLATGADGPRESQVATFDAVRVDGVVFNGVGATATENLSSHAPANVGLEILSRFRVTVDFPRDRLWLQPLPHAAEIPFRKNRTGLALAPDGDRLKVTHVGTGSPAEADGWRVGDEIAAIDGQPVGDGYPGSSLARWIFAPAGRVVTLTMADGSRRALKLADYY